MAELRAACQRRVLASTTTRIASLNLLPPVRSLQHCRSPAPIPGPTVCVGNADDPAGRSPTTSTRPTLAGRAFERFARVNDPKADQTYKSIDIALFKRLSNNWQLLASYSGTTTTTCRSCVERPQGSEFNGNVESGPLNPNGEINTLDNGWESSTKLSGVYTFPFGIMTSGNYELRSGYPWARSGALHRRPDDSEHHGQRRAHRVAPAARQQPARPPRGEDLHVAEGAEVRGARQRLQRAQREHEHRGDPSLRSELPEADRHHVGQNLGVQHDVFVLIRDASTPGVRGAGGPAGPARARQTRPSPSSRLSQARRFRYSARRACSAGLSERPVASAISSAASTVAIARSKSPDAAYAAPSVSNALTLRWSVSAVACSASRTDSDGSRNAGSGPVASNHARSVSASSRSGLAWSALR